MDDPTLARLAHENLVATVIDGLGAAPESLVWRRDGVVLYASGLPIRFFNQVLIEAEVPAPEVIEEAAAVLRDRGQPYLVHLRRRIDDGLRPLMDALGLVLPGDASPMPGMALYPIRPAATSVPAGHRIRRVGDEAGMDDHIRAGALGFGMPEPMLRTIVGADAWLRPGYSVYVGYSDGQPVSTGLGSRTGATIGVYNIATVEHARRQGLGAAITERVAADGAADGCDVAILQASAMGYPTYARLGYRTVIEYDAWIEPERGGAR